ncbi:hypothetical protein IWQ61_004696 [Dispira simplex]|nr:hypothetical protein IWQ61_004696 [Dispira simplex]
MRYSRESSRSIITLCEDMVANQVPLTESAQAHLIRACYLLAKYPRALAYFHSWYPPLRSPSDSWAPPLRDPYAWGCLWTYILACHRLVHRNFTQIFDMYTGYVQLGGRPHQLMMQQLTCALIDEVRWQKSHLTRLAREWQAHFPNATPMFWSFVVVALLRTRRWTEVTEAFEVAQTLAVVLPRSLMHYALKRLFRNGQRNHAQHLWHRIICVPKTGPADSGSSNSATLEEFPYLSTGTINVYVDGLVKHGCHIEAEQLAGALINGAELDHSTSPTRRDHPTCTDPTPLTLCSAFSATIHTYTVMIQGYLSTGDLNNALRIVELVNQRGLAWDAALTDVVCRGLLRLYYTFTPTIPMTEFDKLFGKLVDTIPTPTHAEITTLHYDLTEYSVVHKLLRKARSHGTLGTPDPSLTALYQRTLGHLLTNDDVTLQRSLEIATQTHDLAALLSFLLERGHTHRAVGLFTMCLLPPHHVQPTPVIVNILVRGLAQQGLGQEAAALLDSDHLGHPRLRLEGYLVLFRAYCSQSNLTGALATFTKLCEFDLVASPAQELYTAFIEIIRRFELAEEYAENGLSGPPKPVGQTGRELITQKAFSKAKWCLKCQALLWPYHNHTTGQLRLFIPPTLTNVSTNSVSFLLGYPQGDGGDDQNAEGPPTTGTQTLPVSPDKQLRLQREDPYVDYYYAIMLDGSKLPILPVDTQTALKIMFLRDQYERMKPLGQHHATNITELHILWTPLNVTGSGNVPLRYATSGQSYAYKNQPAGGVVATVVAGILLIALFLYAFYRKRKFSLSEALGMLQDHLTTLQQERQLQQFHDAGVRFVSVEHPPLDIEALEKCFPQICLSEQDLTLIQTVYDTPANRVNLENHPATLADNLCSSLTSSLPPSSPCDPVDQGDRPQFQSFCSGVSIGALLPRSVSMTFESQLNDSIPLQRARTCRSWHERIALCSNVDILRPRSLIIKSPSATPLSATTIAVPPEDINSCEGSSSSPQSYYTTSKVKPSVSEKSQSEVTSFRPADVNNQVPSTPCAPPLNQTYTLASSLLDASRRLIPLKLAQHSKLDEQVSLPNLCHPEHLSQFRPGKPVSLFQPGRHSMRDGPSGILALATSMESMQRNQPNNRTVPSITDDVDAPLCAVCFESFISGDTIRRLFCAHIYHVDCIDPWLLQVASTCPVNMVTTSYLEAMFGTSTAMVSFMSWGRTTDMNRIATPWQSVGLLHHPSSRDERFCFRVESLSRNSAEPPLVRTLTVRPQQVTPAQSRILIELMQQPTPQARFSESLENVAGLSLAIGSLVLYYTLSYPGNAVRLVEHVFHTPVPIPVRFTPSAVPSAAPLYPFQPIRYGYSDFLLVKGHTLGVRSLWKGFPAFLMSQFAHIAYGYAYTRIGYHDFISNQASVGHFRYWTVSTLVKIGQFLATIPFYPFWHMTVIYRLQSITTIANTLSLGRLVTDYGRLVQAAFPPSVTWSQLLLAPYKITLGLGNLALYPAFLHRVLFDMLQTRVVFRRVYHVVIAYSTGLGRNQWWNQLRTMVTSRLGFSRNSPSDGAALPDAIGVNHDEMNDGSNMVDCLVEPTSTRRTMLRQFFPEIVSVITSNLISKSLLYPIETLFYTCIANHDASVLIQSGLVETLAAWRGASPADVEQLTREILGPVPCGLRGSLVVAKAIYRFGNGGISNFYAGLWNGLCMEILASYAVLQTAYWGYRLVMYLTTE